MSGLDPELTRRDNAKARVLAALVEAGASGVTTDALNEICFRYGARLLELRREGHRIDKAHVADGIYRYTYIGGLDAPQRFVPPPSMPVYTTAPPAPAARPSRTTPEQGGLFS